MRLAVVIAALAWAAQFSGTAAADLYRWVDPETGSVKFSSYPPPWYGDEARQRRAPKVEHIPARSTAPARPADTPAPNDVAKAVPEAGEAAQLVAGSSAADRSKFLMKQISALAADLTDTAPGEERKIYADLAEKIRQQKALEAALKQSDPDGEAARRAEWGAAVAGVEGHRRRLLEQVAATRPPAEGASPASAQIAQQGLQRQLAAVAAIDNALKLLDPIGVRRRESEQELLLDRTLRQWKPSADGNRGAPAR